MPNEENLNHLAEPGFANLSTLISQPSTGSLADQRPAAPCQASLLVWPSVDHLFHFLIMFFAGLVDVLYALPEFCSIVSNEICGLQRLRVLM